MALMDNMGSVVYAARLADGIIKIGWTEHFGDRLRWLMARAEGAPSGAAAGEVGMARLSVTLFGLDLLTIEVTTGEDEEDDTSRDLSGGTLGTDRIDPGPTNSFMGFTNGREAGDDDRADRC